jgi:hypothetical protein
MKEIMMEEDNAKMFGKTIEDVIKRFSIADIEYN